ncbi:MAG: hypothetical protein K2X47_10360 [Bdellovibrionales bacterium]|nr:hypothetical protein [Bdellovibrionales bacterium]
MNKTKFSKEEVWGTLYVLLPTMIATSLIGTTYMGGPDWTQWIKGFLMLSAIGSTWIAQAFLKNASWKLKAPLIFLGIPVWWPIALYFIHFG